MKTHVRVAVIGGGLVGCSILYHLTKLGCTDVVLLERDELTSGSTWHAAANVHGLHDTNNVSRLQYYTIKLYTELEAETGQSCGVHQPGSIYLASTRERMHQLRLQRAKARAYGVEFEELSPAEVRDLNPLVDLDGVLCAMYEADGGHVDPSGVTHAYAAGARRLGAEIHRFTPVTETNPRPDGGWDVVTGKGTIHAEAVVNAAGLWGREVGRMAGLELPLMTMEHQYLVTEDIPELAALGRELPSLADRDGEYYLRQEGNALLVGAYEKDGRFWAVDGTPPDFGRELLPDDLERISDNIMRACERMPCLADAGIRRVINGPMIWTPDAGALVGPVPELRNYFVCTGVIPGFSQSGGLGLAVAQWIVDGEPELDLFGWDVARFGAWADKAYTMARAFDSYTSRFRIHFPGEERTAGRPVRTRPVHDLQRDERRAVFGFSFGWEHPLWYAPEGMAREDHFTFERPRWFDAVGRECRALRGGVGVIDISNFAKYRVTGTKAEAWLDGLFANRLPARVGRASLTPMLSLRGGVAGDFTVTRLADDDFYVIGSGIAERYHSRWFNSRLPAAGVDVQSLSAAYTGFNIAGPGSRDLIARLIDEDFSNAGFPFMEGRVCPIGAIEAIVIRVSFTGDLGYEIYVPELHQRAVYESLFRLGADLGVHPVGSRALASLRIEKGYGSWGREYSPEYRPRESRLERLVRDDKGDFFGRDAYLRIKPRPVVRLQGGHVRRRSGWRRAGVRRRRLRRRPAVVRGLRFHRRYQRRAGLS
jgi:dimethylglycine dehydrogenase